MATRLKEVDAVMIGMGWTGSIMARELTKAGLTVIGLERGEGVGGELGLRLQPGGILRAEHAAQVRRQPEMFTDPA